MRERIVDDEEKKPGESASNGKSAFVQQAVKDFLGAFAGGNVGDGLLQAAFKTFYSFFKLSGLDPGAEFKEAVKEAGAHWGEDRVRGQRRDDDFAPATRKRDNDGRHGHRDGSYATGRSSAAERYGWIHG